MAATVTCSNPKCRRVIPTEGKAVGETVKCPRCGMQIQILAEFGSEFDISAIRPVEEGHIHHPARLKCTACGATLGVRDAVCPKCGGDVRTGVTHLRITKEEKARRGLLTRKVGAGPEGRGGVSVVVLAAGVVVLMATIAAVVVVAVLLKSPT